jgi:GDP-4-dehydro-6-deoxy-D-mannose reductase
MSPVQPGDRIAVTGATGFVGQVLADRLAKSGYQVVGISERPEPPPDVGQALYDYHCADLSREWPEVGPFQGVVHLAGLAAVGPSFEHPQEYINTNSAILTHFFEHALQRNWAGRAIIVSSGAVYGSTNDDTGLTEESTPLATSPYVVSKLLVERQAEYYRRRGVDSLIVRPFNHIGPGQRSGFIVPDLAAKVREWRPGTALPVGNLGSARDYTDVRDIASAYKTVMEWREPRHTIYNVCSGVARSGWEVLEAVCTALGKPVPPTVMTDRRAIDPSVILGNADRLKLETGWTPTIKLQASVNDFIANLAL